MTVHSFSTQYNTGPVIYLHHAVAEYDIKRHHVLSIGLSTKHTMK